MSKPGPLQMLGFVLAYSHAKKQSEPLIDSLQGETNAATTGSAILDHVETCLTCGKWSRLAKLSQSGNRFRQGVAA